MNKKGFISPHIGLFILAALVIGAGGYFVLNRISPNVLSYRVAQSPPNESSPSEVANDVMTPDTVVEVVAWGTIVEGVGPRISLELFGKSATTWNITNKRSTYKYVAVDATVRPDDVRVRFMNDFTSPKTKVSRDVKIDFITINGARYDSEDSTVFSTGTWSKDASGVGSCLPGYKSSAWLHCNGYFQYTSKEQEYPLELTYTRLTDDVDLRAQAFFPDEVKFKGKLAKGYVFKVEKGKPYNVHVVDYYDKYDGREYIETYLFDSSKKFIMEAQTNLHIREGAADIRKVSYGLPPEYEGDVYIVVTNKYNDTRGFDIVAYDELKRSPVVMFKSTSDGKLYNLSAITEFDRNFALFTNKGTIQVNLNSDATMLMSPTFDLKVYTLPGTYQEHIQRFIEASSADYKYAKNDGQEIPVRVVKIAPSILEIYALNKNKTFAEPFELANRSQVQIEFSVMGVNNNLYDRSLFFWVE